MLQQTAHCSYSQHVWGYHYFFPRKVLPANRCSGQRPSLPSPTSQAHTLSLSLQSAHYRGPVLPLATRAPDNNNEMQLIGAVAGRPTHQRNRHSQYHTIVAYHPTARGHYNLWYWGIVSMLEDVL